MTEISKSDRRLLAWGRESHGTIDAIPKKEAEQMYNYIREKIDAAKRAAKEQPREQPKAADDSLVVLRMRLARGEITKDEFEELKRVLESS